MTFVEQLQAVRRSFEEDKQVARLQAAHPGWTITPNGAGSFKGRYVDKDGTILFAFGSPDRVTHEIRGHDRRRQPRQKPKPAPHNETG